MFCITLWIAELSVIHNTFCVFSEGGYARLAGGSVIHSQTYLSSYQSLSTHWMNTGIFGVTTHISKCSPWVWTALICDDFPSKTCSSRMSIPPIRKISTLQYQAVCLAIIVAIALSFDMIIPGMSTLVGMVLRTSEVLAKLLTNLTNVAASPSSSSERFYSGSSMSTWTSGLYWSPVTFIRDSKAVIDNPNRHLRGAEYKLNHH